jgi:hypothetical protein
VNVAAQACGGRDPGWIHPGRNARAVRRKDHAALIHPAWVLGAVLAGLAPAPAFADKVNDYPTTARADYVFACMKVNGDTHQALEQCSCSIDVIASILPYDRYVAAEAVLSLAQVPGRFGAMFRSTEPSKGAVTELRRAQAEAEVRCF